MVARQELCEALRCLKQGRGPATVILGSAWTPAVIAHLDPPSEAERQEALLLADACARAALRQLGLDPNRLWLSTAPIERWRQLPNDQRLTRTGHLYWARWLLGWHRFNPHYLADRIAARTPA